MKNYYNNKSFALLISYCEVLGIKFEVTIGRS